MYFAGRASHKSASASAKAAVTLAGYTLVKNPGLAVVAVVLLGDSHQVVKCVPPSAPRIALADLDAWLAAHPAPPPPPTAAGPPAPSALKRRREAPSETESELAARWTYQRAALLTGAELDEVEAVCRAVQVLGASPVGKCRGMADYEENTFYRKLIWPNGEKILTLKPNYWFANVPRWLPGIAAAHAAARRGVPSTRNHGVAQLAHRALNEQRARGNFLCQFFLGLRAIALYEGGGSKTCATLYSEAEDYMCSFCEAFAATWRMHREELPPKRDWRALTQAPIAHARFMDPKDQGMTPVGAYGGADVKKIKCKWLALEQLLLALLDPTATPTRDFVGPVFMALMSMPSRQPERPRLNKELATLAVLHAYNRPDVVALVKASAAALGRPLPRQLPASMRHSLVDSSNGDESLGRLSAAGALVTFLQLLHNVACDARYGAVPLAELCACVPLACAPLEHLSEQFSLKHVRLYDAGTGQWAPMGSPTGEVLLELEGLKQMAARHAAHIGALYLPMVDAHCGRPARHMMSSGSRRLCYKLAAAELATLVEAVQCARQRRNKMGCSLRSARQAMHLTHGALRGYFQIKLNYQDLFNSYECDLAMWRIHVHRVALGFLWLKHVPSIQLRGRAARVGPVTPPYISLTPPYVSVPLANPPLDRA